MPKLGDELANKVEAAEDGFKPIDDGIYILQLMEDVKVAEGQKGPYWSWTFEIPKLDEDGEETPNAGRRFWHNTSLSEAAFFKLKETFSAFGVPTNTDTEDLVGRKVKALISRIIIQQGKRKGEPGNEITNLYPLDYEPGDEAEGGTKIDTVTGGSKEEPLF